MKSWYRTIACVICMTILAGCWNRRELNELAVSVAIGVDKRGDQNLVSSQILNTGAITGKEGGSFGLAPVVLFSEKGVGIHEPFRRMSTRSARKLYVGQMQMIVFGEEFARAGVGKVLDHISRDHEYRKDIYVVVARGAEAKDVLTVYTPLDKIPATKLKASLETSAKVWGSTAAVKFEELISTIVSKGKESVLTGVKIIGNPKFGNDKADVGKISVPTGLKYAGLAVFKKDKLLGWLNEEESQGYNYTQGNIKSTTVLMPCPTDKNKMTVELLRTKNKTKVSMENGKPVINLKIKAEGVITDIQCGMDLTKPTSISEVEHLTDRQIKASISSAVKTLQNRYKSDIFGFGEDVARKYPKYWKKVQKDWDDIFSSMRVNIEVETKIRRMYKTTKSIYERMGD